MSTPVFIDLPIPEQAQELRIFLKSFGASISEEPSEDGIHSDLKNIIEATSVCWTEINNEADLEMIFNSIISLILAMPPEEMAEPITMFCEKVGKQQKTDKRSQNRIKVLSNLFYGIDEKSVLRADVYVAMVKLAHQSDLIQMVDTDLDKVKKWTSMWDISPKKLQNLLRNLHDALIDSKLSENATKVMIDLLGSYTEDNASQARDDAHRCIVTHLGDPNTFLMDHLLTLKPVKFLEGELIHDLLTIFVSGKIAQYQQFYKNNTDFVKSLCLSHEQNMRKMRLLTFMQMAENRMEIEYSVLQEEMMMSQEEIEPFVIDVLRTKAVRAKIDQMQKKVLISSTTHRTFGRQQWQMLKQHLIQWKENLKGVQASLSQLDLINNQTTAT
ncbi:eukaryotic translation initiation factor 3 subunit M-like [Mizuhopecten yessoensis]|uniref:Eukaryotic translation initiation factor 3 subunit M n=1 Tax=Mizuhopecten yessoensis TaxID=6573 RepID=A0A210PYX9_MIZYE|nr:eukaryotic translation initiation factor 3 subunit M-like [Mizuhopecten yessoensis]OWF41682.1 Eukaryotic translation initiation factor 3 subunit M [Mizuhopecten yessoensis]